MKLKDIFPYIFHGNTLYIVKFKGEPYVAMKHVVEGMGLDWKSQHRRLTERFESCMVEMTMQLRIDDQRRQVSCLALRKLPGWLMTINANKVSPEIRDKVIQYQQECDDALYEYWTKGIAISNKLTASDWLKYHHQFYKVLDQIARQRQYGIRKALYDELESMAGVLNKDIPELTDIVGKEPEVGDPRLDSDEVYEFWDLFEMLENPASPKLNHSQDPDIIAIEPFEFRQYCKQRELEFPSLDVVRREMRSRSRFPFEGYREIKSNIAGKTLRCWTFRAK